MTKRFNVWVTLLGLVVICSSEASPTWSFYSLDQKKWVDFKFDEKKLCVEPKVNGARSDEERAKLGLVPADIKKEMIPMFAASTDARKHVETNKMFCQLSLLLSGTKCNFDDLKIVSRVAKFKLGMPNEKPDGGNYISEIAIHGCSKAKGEIPERCIYTKERHGRYDYPMDSETYQKFIQSCYFALYSIGGRYDADIKRVDASSVVAPMLDGHVPTSP